MKQKQQRFKSWLLLFVLILCGGALFLSLRDNSVSQAKEQLTAKGFSIKPAYRQQDNFIESSLHDFKGILKIEEIEIYRTVWYKEEKTLEVTSELDILAPYIEHLSCGLTRIQDSDATVIGKMRQLKHLEMYGPQLTNRGARELSGLQDLEWFVLSAPQVTDAGLAWLQQCGGLKWLILSETSVSGGTLKQISHAHDLLTLDLGKTNVRSVDLQHLTNLHALRRLVLANTKNR